MNFYIKKSLKRLVYCTLVGYTRAVHNMFPNCPTASKQFIVSSDCMYVI